MRFVLEGAAWKLLWIVVAMVGARSAGMAFNRILDADIDGRNPRTKMRHLPAGLLSAGFAWGFLAGMSGVLILAAAITVSVIGFPVYLAMLIGALLMIVMGLLTMEDAYRAMEWRAIFLIAGMYSVGVAMAQTGLATLVGDGVLKIVSPFGPLGLAAGSYLLTASLTQFMGSQVTALVTVPIAISAALSMQTSPQAMAVAAAIGCSAAFLTPIAHPVNILMMGPGNYRFRDFFRVGWWLTVLSFVMLLLGMVLFWGL